MNMLVWLALKLLKLRYLRVVNWLLYNSIGSNSANFLISRISPANMQD